MQPVGSCRKLSPLPGWDASVYKNQQVDEIMSEDTVSASHERRLFQRILFDADVTIIADNGEWQSRLIDLSLKGVLLREPDRFQPEGTLKLAIPLGGSSQHIMMQIKVSHHEDGHLGCVWEDIDIESFSHLRRLLELNLGDPELVNRELSELAKDRQEDAPPAGIDGSDIVK